MNDKRQIPEPDACGVEYVEIELMLAPVRTGDRYRVVVTDTDEGLPLIQFWLIVENGKCIGIDASQGGLVLEYQKSKHHQLQKCATSLSYESRKPLVQWRASGDNNATKALGLYPSVWPSSSFVSVAQNAKNQKDSRPWDNKKERPALKRDNVYLLASGFIKVQEFKYLQGIPSLDGDHRFKFRLGEGSSVPPVRGSKLAKALWSIRQAGFTEIPAKQLETVIRRGITLV